MNLMYLTTHKLLGNLYFAKAMRDSLYQLTLGMGEP